MKQEQLSEDELLAQVTSAEYKYGFTTDIEADTIAKGLSEEVVRIISKKKNEPEWMLDYRLKAFNEWLEMEEPDWANVDYPKPNYQDIIYYSAPKQKKTLDSLDDLDPELKKTFDKLGISLNEQKRLSGVAVDIVMDSVSVATSFKSKLAELGIIFCSISEAIQEHPELVKKYLGTVVPARDNFFSALNAAVFSDGSFCYIPKGSRCPMELSTYFRINEAGTGQFERTLLIADEGSYVSYLEGCTAPQRDENHAPQIRLFPRVERFQLLRQIHRRFQTRLQPSPLILLKRIFTKVFALRVEIPDRAQHSAIKVKLRVQPRDTLPSRFTLHVFPHERFPRLHVFASIFLHVRDFFVLL